MERRTFLGMLGGTGLAAGVRGEAIPIIDTHIHLFDPTRPEGVPWPGKKDTILYRPALPDRYRKVTEGLGIVGAIEIECSPWLEDNQWVLDVAAKDPIIVATIGDLEPGDPNFGRQLERFHRNPIFRGIRYGNLWGRDLGTQLTKPVFMDGLRALAQAGMVLDTANPDPALISQILRLTDRLPGLTVVIDHLPQLNPPSDKPARNTYISHLRQLASRPKLFVKVSEVLRREGGRVPTDAGFYKDRLDEIWDIFGQDRLIYGSDWPNSDEWGTYPQVLKIVREYFTAKGPAAAAKYFWQNSVAAYHWTKRDADQPNPS